MDSLAREARDALVQRGERLRRARTRPSPEAEGEERELVEIDAALTRIALGLFGRCERCGGAMGRNRLRAVPEARYCVTCVALGG
ncbi:TraR/DksA family transcriptional regulator [Myxococcus landrumensis]|uniref:TraR/DksA C4-type zinc finger protein n=1 Tax=Myxococcus landrumensis TaxID=2813577 RepID=A0ABX7N4N1_9BACT|nr:TraR/DksA C4-type zinc finger protein [Myxococcus landrumus]QSQ12361.1 TraR/DksA C4-type zinc finger protein [Myxococcus landrumus]